MKGLRSLFKRIKNSLSKEKTVNLDHTPEYVASKTNSLVGGRINTTLELVYKIIDLVNEQPKNTIFENQDPTMNSISSLLSYISLISSKNLIPYGENIMKTLESINDLDFEFTDHKEDDGSYNIYCLIRDNYDSNPFAIYRVSFNSDDYVKINTFAIKATCNEAFNNTVIGYAYRHICGIIYSHVKERIIKLPVYEDSNFIYIVKDWPEECELIKFDYLDW